MRLIPLAIGLILLGYGAGFARADVRSYCTAYARDAADAALGVTGAGTLAGANNDQWAAENTTALDQCLALYGQPQAQAEAAQPTGAEPAGKQSAAPAKVAAAPAPAAQRHASPPAGKQRMKLIASAHAPPIASVSPSQGGAGNSGLQPGTAAWNAYCAKKYTSFNPATGTYKSYKGNQRRCVVTRH